MTLEDEERRASEMLAGKTVKSIRRHRPTEVLIEFTDDTRLYVDSDHPVEMSITGAFGDDG